jgi:hypothetical protein
VVADCIDHLGTERADVVEKATQLIATSAAANNGRGQLMACIKVYRRLKQSDNPAATEIGANLCSAVLGLGFASTGVPFYSLSTKNTQHLQV